MDEEKWTWLSGLYEEFKKPLWSYFYSRHRNGDDADDLLCEVFLRAIELTEKGRFPSDREHAAALLFRIAYGKFVDFLRKNAKEEEATRGYGEEMKTSMEENGDLTRRIHDILAETFESGALNERQVFIVHMRYLCQRPIREITEALGVTRNVYYHERDGAFAKLREVFRKVGLRPEELEV